MPLLAAAVLFGSAFRGAVLRTSTLGGTLQRRGFATLSSAPPPPARLLLTSAGLTTPCLESTFRRMLQHATDDGAGSPNIAMLVTAQLAPSSTRTSPDRDQDGNLIRKEVSKRSPGELRRRRWADARKKGREIEQQLGVPVECIDCVREKDLEDARAALSTAGCIWVTGGNTFFLRHHLRASGLDDLVRQRVVSDGALYVGASAGSIVAGKSIRTALWKGWDDPAAAGDEVDWSAAGMYDALGLVPDASFFPHYDAAAWKGLVDSQKSGLDHECIVLTDDGESVYVAGDGETT